MGLRGNFYLGRDMNILYTGPGYPGFHEAMRDGRVNRGVLFRGVGYKELTEAGFRMTGQVGPTLLMVRP